MKILIIGLIFGNRPRDIIADNLKRAGYPFTYLAINKLGIAQAQNEGLQLAKNFDAVGFLANDIIEPDNWLKKKKEALESYPMAGIVSTSVEYKTSNILNTVIIGNYLISRTILAKVGYFNELIYPYGPIDLEYCKRVHLAGFNTYYVVDEEAIHMGSHAQGSEYGWSKEALVQEHWNKLDNPLIYRPIWQDHMEQNT